jgi:hypothetical protein
MIKMVKKTISNRVIRNCDERPVWQVIRVTRILHKGAGQPGMVPIHDHGMLWNGHPAGKRCTGSSLPFQSEPGPGAAPLSARRRSRIPGDIPDASPAGIPGCPLQVLSENYLSVRQHLPRGFDEGMHISTVVRDTERFVA